jgi:hypothetical protein
MPTAQLPCLHALLGGRDPHVWVHMCHRLQVKDRRETDVDCGGGECFQACAVGQMCNGGVGSWDCRSRICSSGRCLEADSCRNLVQDGMETGEF